MRQVVRIPSIPLGSRNPTGATLTTPPTETVALTRVLRLYVRSFFRSLRIFRAYASAAEVHFTSCVTQKCRTYLIKKLTLKDLAIGSVSFSILSPEG